MLEQLYSIVNARYEDERAIVITTNLERDAARRADRRADRLAAGGDVRRSLPALRRRTTRGRPDVRSPDTPTLRPDMPGIVIVGAQWGDEGKGKVVDLLAERADMVVRFQGGNNAGHTIVRDGRRGSST